MTPTPKISVIMPVLNEAHSIESAIAGVPKGIEVIVVDGGSSDGTLDRASRSGATVIHAAKGRGKQMNAGAHIARGDILVFLHADTLLPGNVVDELNDFWQSEAEWGRFDVRLSGEQMIFRIIETLMNARSRYTGICTGDQGLFARRSAFEEAGGYANIPLMEDIEFSKRMKKRTPPYCSYAFVFTSSRRWEQRGVMRTILSMWWCRLQYFFGRSPEKLFQQYYS